MGGRVRRIGLTALTCGLAGPPAGLAAYLALGLDAGAAFDPAGLLLGGLWLLPFAYLLGGGPALLTGALAGAVMAPGRGIPYLLLVTALGGAVAGAVALLTADPLRLDRGVWNFAVIGAVGGLAGALVSAFLYRPSRGAGAPVGQP